MSNDTWRPQRLAGSQDEGEGRSDASWGGGMDIDLSRYLRILQKHRLLIIGATILVFAIGLAITLLTTPTYTATATVQIDREAARVFDNMSDVTPTETASQGIEFFETQYGLLRSRSLAERVVDALGLATTDVFLKDMGSSPPSTDGKSAADVARERREAVLSLVENNLVVTPVRGSRLVRISFESPKPALSARVANAFAENFIQSNLDRRFESTAYARKFLEDRIAQTKQRLEEIERELVSYAAQEQIINVGGNEGLGQVVQQESLASRSLGSLNAILAQAQAARVLAEEQWRRAEGTGLMTLPDVLQNPTIQRLSEERAKVSAELEQKASIYRPDYPEMRQLQARLSEINSQIDAVAGGIRASVRSNYVVAVNQERALQARVNGLKGDVLSLRERSVQYNILQRELDTSRVLYDGLLQRYKEVGVSGGVTTNNISIIDRADAPKQPSKPKMLLNLALALVLGLGLGVATAVLRELLDETLATPADVEQKLGLKVIGVSPLLDKGQTPMRALEDIRSGFSEAYYSLRTALQFSTPNGAPTSLLVTSSKPSEGKSTTAYAVASNLARIGKRVLLVDGDLRNPSMHRMLRQDNARGMSNILSDSASRDEVTLDSGIPNMSFIPCGPLPPNPAELWSGPHLRTFLDGATADYDHVVIDGPPVLGFADAPVLANAVQGTIVVMEARGVRRGQARGALNRLAIGGARLLGVVLTKFQTKTAKYGGYGYDYAYDYSYGSTPTPGADKP